MDKINIEANGTDIMTQKEYGDRFQGGTRKQVGLNYKLRYKDYCSLMEDKWVKTYIELLILLTIPLPNKKMGKNPNSGKYFSKAQTSPNDRLKKHRDSKNFGYKFYIDLIEQFEKMIKYFKNNSNELDFSELKKWKERNDISDRLVPNDITIEKMEDTLDIIKKQFEDMKPSLKGHSARSGKNIERNKLLISIAETMIELGYIKERIKEFLFIVLYEINFDDLIKRCETDIDSIEFDYREIFKQVINDVKTI